MNLESAGKWLLLVGLGIALLGGLIWLLGRFLPGGNTIPGTLRFQVGQVTCFIPLLATIVLSVLLTVILNLAAKLIK